MVLVLVAQLFVAQLLVLLLQVQLSELQFWAQPSTLLFVIFLIGQHSRYFNYYYLFGYLQLNLQIFLNWRCLQFSPSLVLLEIFQAAHWQL